LLKVAARPEKRRCMSVLGGREARREKKKDEENDSKAEKEPTFFRYKGEWILIKVA